MKKVLELILSGFLFSFGTLFADEAKIPWPHQSPDLTPDEIGIFVQNLSLGRVFGQIYQDAQGEFLMYDGMDILLDGDTPVYAVKDGWVLYKTDKLVVVGSPRDIPTDLSWRMNQSFQYYANFLPDSTLEKGDGVKKGQKIGFYKADSAEAGGFYFSMGINSLNSNYTPFGCDYSRRSEIRFYNPLSQLQFIDTQPPVFCGDPVFTVLDQNEMQELPGAVTETAALFIPLYDDLDSQVPGTDQAVVRGCLPRRIDVTVSDPLEPTKITAEYDLDMTQEIVLNNAGYSTQFWRYFLSFALIREKHGDERASLYYVAHIDPDVILKDYPELKEKTMLLTVRSTDFNGNQSEMSHLRVFAPKSRTIKKGRSKR